MTLTPLCKNLAKTANSPDPHTQLLKKSIDRFSAEYRKGVTDFSAFISIFSRVLQNTPDPPLEITWFYSALTFHTAKFAAQGPEETLLVAKDLFHLLVSCTASCRSPKRIAVLAPLVWVLFHLVTEEKTLKREVEDLIDRLVSYISICCGTEDQEEDWNVELGSCFVDCSRVWMVDKFGEDLRMFFPLIGNGVCKRIMVDCKVKDLAGVVLSEAFLLRLCLKFEFGVSKLELQKDLHNWAVQTLIGFRSNYFYDTFLRMLLEPVLPVTSLLDSADEVLLREVLYDSVIGKEYRFLIPLTGTQLPPIHLKNLALGWLFVADKGIRFARENCNLTQTISYMNAFHESCLPSQLITWVMNQPGFDKKMSKPNISTPIALINWLLVVEDQGVRIFDFVISSCQVKEVVCGPRIEFSLPVIKADCKNLGSNLFNSGTDVKEEDAFDCDLEMVDSMDSAALSAPGSFKITINDCRRKRKGRDDNQDVKLKFLKYHFHENSEIERFLPFCRDYGLSNGIEVDNQLPDQDMVDI